MKRTNSNDKEMVKNVKQVSNNEKKNLLETFNNVSIKLNENEANSNQHHEKREAIKNILQQVLRNSFAQAVIKLFFTPYLGLKTFLFLFVFVSMGLTGFLIVQSINTYLSYGVSTFSRTIYETPTLFPKVTFCNVNQLTTEYAYNLTQMRGEIDHNKLSNEEKKLLAHHLDDILIECWFNLNRCSSNDFIWSFDEAYGNCYTFNSGIDSNGSKVDLKQTKIAGAAFGLQLTLYVNFYEKLSELSTMDVLGTVFYVGNTSFNTKHSTTYSNSGFLVSSGFQTAIVVDREFKSMLPKPYSSCEIHSDSSKFRLDSNFYNLIAQSKYDYTQKFCFLQCIQNYYVNKYNCSLPFLPSLFNQSACDFRYLWDVIFKSDVIVKGEFINQVCLPMCPLECDQTIYKTSLSSAQLIGNNYFMSTLKKNPHLAADFIHRTIDAQTAKESIVMVKIFYDSLSYTLTTESPQMDIVSLLASIGGNLSLFLGVSMFSLWEIIEVTIEFYYFPAKVSKKTCLMTG